MYRILCYVVLFILILVPNTNAAPMVNQPIGARAFSLGGAFTSIPGGAASIGWNPAGLAATGSSELIVTRASFIKDVKYNNIATSHNLEGFISFGIGVYALESTDIPWTDNNGDLIGTFDYNATNYYFTIAKEQTDLIRWGIGVKYLIERLASEDAWSAGLDIGVQIKLSKEDSFTFGFTLFDLGGTVVHWSTGAKDIVYPSYVLGASGKIFNTKFSLDYDSSQRVHFGLEKPITTGLLLRSGGQFLLGEGLETYSVGMGIQTKVIGVDYAFVGEYDRPESMPTQLGNSHQISFYLHW